MRARKDRQAQILDLVGRVYDAALDPNSWCGVATTLAETFGSTSAAIQLRHVPTGSIELLAMTQNYNSGSLGAYQSYYGQRDLWLQAAAKLGGPHVVLGQEIVNESEFARSEIYNDWCREVGDIFHIVGAVYPVGGAEIFGIGIHRPRGGPSFVAEDKTHVAQFLPHLQRALQIRQRLADPGIERSAALDALERSGTATLVVTRDSRLLYANPLAERLLRAKDGIRVAGGQIGVGQRAAAERLTALVRAAADAAAGRGTASGGTLAIARPDRLPLTLLVAPFRPAREGLGAPLPAAVLFVRDPEAASPTALSLQGLFGLTAAEAAVAVALAQGRAAEDLAGRLGVSLNTVRTHIKNVLAKTGTSRQAQLVALILGSVATLTLG